MRDQIRARLSDHSVLAGLVLGLAGLAVAYLFRLFAPGRLLSDPLPLALLPTALLRSLREGFVYLDLRSPVLHLLFAVVLGIAAAWLTTRRRGKPEQARRIARIALGLSILAVAVQEVDAMIVAFYYGISAFVSLSISAYAADRMVRRLQRNRATNLSDRGAGERSLG